MAILPLTDCFVHAAGYDFTTDTNKLQLDTEVAALDATTFGGGGWTALAGGLKSQKLDMEGFWQSAVDQAVDPQAFPALGTSQVFTVGPAASETSVAYMLQAMKSQYVIGGSVGDLAPFTLNSMGSDGVGVVRGQVAKVRGTVSATGQLGSVLNLGLVGATQFLYATFHVFSAGTTITIQVQSDDAAPFGTPTTRATIGPLTTTGGTWMTRVAGPIATDTFWRFNVSAITGSFIVAGAIGIQ